MSMKTILLILLINFSFPLFGQDSVTIETMEHPIIVPLQNDVVADTVSVVIKDPVIKKQKQKRKAVKATTIEAPVVNVNTKTVDNKGGDNGRIILGLFILSIVIIITSAIVMSNRDNGPPTDKDDELIADEISRATLPRREYYRNVYLNSDAWKRKRFVVLRRDNWRCVYCGAKATQVHHKRYAKRNIGKEPIEWLVSICKSCHDAIHE